MVRKPLLAASIPILMVQSILAQTPVAFEVAAIKQAPDLAEMLRSGNMHLGVKLDGSRVDFGAMSLGELIQYAFHIKSFQLEGRADTSPRFDIVAKLPLGETPDDVPAMLQQLLEERFRLAFHWDSKQFPVYAMVVGPKGANLQRRPDDFDRAKDRARPLAQQMGSITLDRVAEFLGPYFGRSVVNDTGLTGEFMIPTGRIVQAWPNRWQERYEARRAGAEPQATLPDPSQVIAILAELGLKVESRKMAFPVMVIERLESKPIEQ